MNEEERQHGREQTTIIGKKLQRCINEYIMENPYGLHPSHICAALAHVAGEFHSHLSENDRDAFIKTFLVVASKPSPHVKIIKMETNKPQ